MNVQVIHDQVDGVGCRILHREAAGNLREFERRPIWCGEREVPARLGFYRTEDIRGASPLVFVVSPGFPSGNGGRWGANIGMQCDRFLIQAYYRLLGIVWLLIGFQNVFHFGDVVFAEVGDAPHFFPATA